MVVRSKERLAEGAPEMILRQPGYGAVSGLEFSQDGAGLAVLWDAEPVGLACWYEVPSGQLVTEQAVRAHSTLRHDPQSARLALAGPDPWLNLLRVGDPPPSHPVYDDGNQGMGDFIDPAQPLRPPRRLLTRSAQSVRQLLLFGHEAPPMDLLFLPGEAALLSTGPDRTLRRWPLEPTGPLTHRLNNIETGQPFDHPMASRAGRRVLAWHIDGVPVVWEAGQNRQLMLPAGHRGLACFDDGRVLTRNAQEARLTCWETAGGQASVAWSVPCDPGIPGFPQVCHSAQSADGRRVAALLPGRLLVVDMDSKVVRETPDQVMDFGTTPGLTVSLSPDGVQVAVTGFVGRRARIYRAEDPAGGHRKLIPAQTLTTHDTTCAFSADGRRLFVGNEDGWMRVYDPESGQEIPGESWKAHTTAITALAVAPGGGVVGTAAEGSMALWSASPGSDGQRRSRLRVNQDKALNWMQFTAGDKALLFSAPQRPVELWEAP